MTAQSSGRHFSPVSSFLALPVCIESIDKHSPGGPADCASSHLISSHAKRPITIKARIVCRSTVATQSKDCASHDESRLARTMHSKARNTHI